MKKILIVDDEVSICKILSQFLNKSGYETNIATCGKQALKILKTEAFDLILCDYKLGDISGADILKNIQETAPNTIMIFISGYGTIPTAVNLVKEGAYQFLTKPLYPDLILETIENAFQEKRGVSTKNTAVRQDGFSNYIKGESEAAKKLFNYVDLVAPTDYSVIIYGETGTGKEALAKFLHQGSTRKDKPFIAIDCGSLSKDLAASELFGYMKGAFTGATHDKKGAFELAEGGTIFLDEIGNLSYAVQVYLLRVLQEKIVRRVGDLRERQVDVRVIVASNESLPDLVQAKKFREDLYHRLNEFTLEVPALRDRKEDIPFFVAGFLKQAGDHLNKNIKGLSPQVWALFNAYQWPGNIRELQNIIKRACLLAHAGGYVDVDCLPLEILAPAQSAEMEPTALTEAWNRGALFEPNHQPSGLKEISLKAECDKILRVLKEVNYNKTKAAELLEIDRKTLYNKLKEMRRFNDKLQY